MIRKQYLTKWTPHTKSHVSVLNLKLTYVFIKVLFTKSRYVPFNNVSYDTFTKKSSGPFYVSLENLFHFTNLFVKKVERLI